MRVLSGTVLVAALFALTACGSAHRKASSYSVKRVVSAFTANGIALHMAPGACSAGFVCLDNRDQGVEAYVFVGPKSGQLSILAAGSDHQTNKANLTVVWEHQYRRKVQKALRSLT